MAEKSRSGEIRPRIKVQLAGTEPFFGPGVRMLLECIREEGSVREACEKMGLSYSKGRKSWDIPSSSEAREERTEAAPESAKKA